MLRKTKLCTGLMVACGGVLLSAGQSAMAQATQSLERVEITGSNIKRIDAEGANPVLTITKEEDPLSREIRSGTALAVLAKPVSRTAFLLAKYVGVAMALTVLAYLNILAGLLASRMAYDAYGSTDWLALLVFCGGLLLAFGIGGFSNYFCFNAGSIFMGNLFFERSWYKNITFKF